MTIDPTIYIVMGRTGEYSDKKEWPVCFRVSEKEAQDIVVLLTKEAADFWAWLEANGYSRYDANTPPEKEEDPKLWERWQQLSDGKFRMDYTGTRYFVWAITESLKQEDTKTFLSTIAPGTLKEKSPCH